MCAAYRSSTALDSSKPAREFGHVRDARAKPGKNIIVWPVVDESSEWIQHTDTTSGVKTPLNALFLEASLRYELTNRCDLRRGVPLVFYRQGARGSGARALPRGAPERTEVEDSMFSRLDLLK